jgi:hypothetical protein
MKGQAMTMTTDETRITDAPAWLNLDAFDQSVLDEVRAAHHDLLDYVAEGKTGGHDRCW